MNHYDYDLRGFSENLEIHVQKAFKSFQGYVFFWECMNTRNPEKYLDLASNTYDFDLHLDHGVTFG